MEILVTYDVATDSAAGRRRLRRVAKACEGFGQRVQKSVFECTLNPGQFAQFRHRLLEIIDEEEDGLRIYRLREPREGHIEVWGRKPPFDMNEPLVL